MQGSQIRCDRPDSEEKNLRKKIEVERIDHPSFLRPRFEYTSSLFFYVSLVFFLLLEKQLTCALILSVVNECVAGKNGEYESLTSSEMMMMRSSSSSSTECCVSIKKPEQLVCAFWLVRRTDAAQ